MKRPVVLHVTESLGSGVANAIVDFALSASDYEHIVAGSWRPGANIGDRVAAVAELVELPASRMRQPPVIWRLVKRLDPELVHVHSSIAGAIVRTLPISRSKIVYSPHCFAFERLDVKPPVRRAFKVAERMLARRTRGIIAVSPREAELARELRSDCPVFYVPNTVRVGDGPSDGVVGPTTNRLLAGTVGRLCPQKGPDFFAAAVESAKALGLGIDWIWIGGGLSETEFELRARGVRVTGWVTHTEALQHLRTLDVYVHTAAWEGAPISVLEAADLGLPIVGRRIPALESMGLEMLVDQPAELARAVGAVADPTERSRRVAASQLLAARHSPRAQTAALAAVYRTLMHGCVRPVIGPVLERASS